METHVIHWVSTVNGKAGVGTKQFEKEESERPGAELNESCPEIDHEAILPMPPAAGPAIEPSPAEGPHSRRGLAPCPQTEAEVPAAKSMDEFSP